MPVRRPLPREGSLMTCSACGKDRTLLVRIIGEAERYCWPCAAVVIHDLWMSGAFTPEREAEGGTIEEAVS
jgi:hypothetical protein